jgi:hypothetical protein
VEASIRKGVTKSVTDDIARMNVMKECFPLKLII